MTEMRRGAKHRRGRWACLLVAMLTIATLGCATHLLQKEVVFTRAQLQKEVDGVFPVREKQSLLRATFSDPEILLEPGGERIGLSLTVAVKLPVGGEVDGTLIVDSGLIYDPERAEIALADPRLRNLNLDGVPERFRPALGAIAEVVARRYLAQIPVYRLDADEFEQSLARLVLKSVSVRDGEVVAVVGF